MSTAGNFVVIAEFTVLPGKLDEFLEHAHLDAKSSIANEEGCIAFDVTTPENGDSIALFHEVYADRAAYEKHTTLPHFLAFRDGIASLLACPRTVRFFQVR